MASSGASQGTQGQGLQYPPGMYDTQGNQNPCPWNQAPTTHGPPVASSTPVAPNYYMPTQGALGCTIPGFEEIVTREALEYCTQEFEVLQQRGMDKLRASRPNEDPGLLIQLLKIDMEQSKKDFGPGSAAFKDRCMEVNARVLAGNGPKAPPMVLLQAAQATQAIPKAVPQAATEGDGTQAIFGRNVAVQGTIQATQAQDPWKNFSPGTSSGTRDDTRPPDWNHDTYYQWIHGHAVEAMYSGKGKDSEKGKGKRTHDDGPKGEGKGKRPRQHSG